MSNFNLERFKKLSRQPSATWQGGVFRLPTWVLDDDGKPFRPMMALWADVTTGIVSSPQFVEDGKPLHTAFDALVDFGLSAGRKGHRPLAIEVQDAELADFLKPRLAGTGTRIDCVDNLPAIQALLDDFNKTMNTREEPPGSLTGKGVGIEQMRSFAESAAGFFAARPWDELSDEDLIQIEAPVAPKGMAFVTVLGHGGHTFGLGFFDSLKEFEKMHAADSPEQYFSRKGVWSLTFGDITELPIADADLWESHQFQVEAENGFPNVFWFGPKKKLHRPNVDELDFITGLLQSLTGVKPDELDRGRWTRNVNTGGRDVEFRLALVHESAAEDEKPRLPIDHHNARRAMEKAMAGLDRLLAEEDFGSPDEANAFIQQHLGSIESLAPRPTTPLDQAQEIMFEAWDARGRRRRSLARKALEVCKDCADAYVMLAEESGELHEAVAFFEQGVQAGERALGPQFFEENAGHFWGILETRPYMRARFGLAQCLWELDRRHEAVTHYEDLLRLNPGDNQGVRYLLAACLLELNDNDKLGKLLQDNEDECSAQWLYIRALWTYRQEGDSKTARKRAGEAVKSNVHVPEFLSGTRRIPPQLPATYQLGHEDEAIICAAELGDNWRATPGAVEWLANFRGTRRRK
ncbi:MAG TPA: hypothetical protein PK093_05590 [Phycisphaerae bacterium]|nr:hypothetical protein [Phycisphaerae bacterium]